MDSLQVGARPPALETDPPGCEVGRLLFNSTEYADLRIAFRDPFFSGIR
jgi:hypothetical protein